MLLDGVEGRIIRLRAAYDALNSLTGSVSPSQSLIDALQVGDRLQYYPGTARKELARFPMVYQQALSDIQSLVDKVDIPDAQLAERVAQGQDPNTALDRARRYKSTLRRALAMLQSPW